jgi:hypothetical protein
MYLKCHFENAVTNFMKHSIKASHTHVAVVIILFKPASSMKLTKINCLKLELI